MKQEGNIIYAERGKVFRRIGTDDIYGDSIILGYSYYINGEKLSEPHLDVPEDFEEVDSDEPITDEEALQIITGQ
jgi:hypothetical protein